jgi:hypothetical protein
MNLQKLICERLPIKGMKTLTLNGVPYSVDDAGNAYAYGSSIVLGKVDMNTKQLTLTDGWEKFGSAYLAEYREGLKVKTVAAIERAAQQQKPI